MASGKVRLSIGSSFSPIPPSTNPDEQNVGEIYMLS